MFQPNASDIVLQYFNYYSNWWNKLFHSLYLVALTLKVIYKKSFNYHPFCKRFDKINANSNTTVKCYTFYFQQNPLSNNKHKYCSTLSINITFKSNTRSSLRNSRCEMAGRSTRASKTLGPDKSANHNSTVC